MDLPATVVIIFIVGAFTSFIGSIVGGGGLISIPFLIFLGLPPQAAIATNKLGAIGMGIGAIPKFWKAKKIIWKYVIQFTILGIAGAFLGATLLLSINEAVLAKVVSIILLAFLPILFFKKKIGVKRHETGSAKKALGYGLYFLIMIYTGFFGGGAGILIFYALMLTFGLTIIEANATDMIPWIIATVVSFIVFAVNGIVNYAYGIPLMLGMILGGYIGAHTAIKKGDMWVKSLFAVIVVASAVKLLFFG